MTYEEALDFVYSRRKYAKSSGHERIKALLEKLGRPQDSLEFVHVVGTNGKGSVSCAVCCILTRAKIKTGLFTSPFVVDFRERIRIGESYISKDDFCRISQIVKEKSKELESQQLYPTFFETVLATALFFFKESGCKVAVLEAGIGGKDDSTNIIDSALATIIMSVSLDHTEVLGNTLCEIAKSKAGAIKSGCPVVSFPKENGTLDFVAQQEEVCSVLESVCLEKGSTLCFPDMKKVKNVVETLGGTSFDYDGESYKIKLLGDHQVANAVCAVECCKILKEQGFEVSQSDIQNGLFDLFMPARTQVVFSNPLLILDGGHNPGCMQALKKTVLRHLKGKKITALLAFMKDKDYRSCLEIIAPLCQNIVFTLADNGPRAERPEELKKASNGLCSNVFCVESQEEALEKARGLCANDDCALICAGSFYLVSKIKNILGV